MWLLIHCLVDPLNPPSHEKSLKMATWSFFDPAAKVLFVRLSNRTVLCVAPGHRIIPCVYVKCQCVKLNLSLLLPISAQHRIYRWYHWTIVDIHDAFIMWVYQTSGREIWNITTCFAYWRHCRCIPAGFLMHEIDHSLMPGAYALSYIFIRVDYYCFD